MDAKQGADADLTDLADGTLSASKVENAITSAGTDGQVWTSDGEGAGVWEAVPSATLTGLGVTATAAELNILDGVTATTSELNMVDSISATVAELNYVDGVTSSIQTQLDSKATSINDLSDALIEGNSIYIGNNPSSSTSTAEYNVGLGKNVVSYTHLTLPTNREV